MRAIDSIVNSYFPLLAAEARAKAAERDLAAEIGYDLSRVPKSRGFVDRTCSAFVWVLDHQGTACAMLAAAIVLLATVSQFANPREALAFPLLPIIIGVTAIGGFFVADDVLGAASQGVSDALRDGANFCLASVSAAVDSFTKSNMLTQDLDSIMPGVVDVLRNIHSTIAIPAANVVLLVFLLVGLGKVISSMSKAETGIDLWQLCMVFVGFAFAKSIVDGSWALMQLAFEIVRWIIIGIANNPVAEMTYLTNSIPDSVTNWGILLMLMLVSFIMQLIVHFVIVLANIAILVRVIQVYVYICLAPLPLATLVSDGGRSIAAHFAKAFMSVLVAGAILSLLFVMMGVFVTTMSLSKIDPSSVDQWLLWVTELFYSIGVFIAFGWCVFQSGTWARDFTGA